jgi:hypothetical protein
VLVAGAPGRAAIGLDEDRGRLLVAGGETGKAFVYDARTGVLIREYQLATAPTFVNDVVVTRTAAYFTDSRRAAIYRIALAPNGTPAATATTIPLTGDFTLVDGFNLNGIAATPNGRTLGPSRVRIPPPRLDQKPLAQAVSWLARSISQSADPCQATQRRSAARLPIRQRLRRSR